MDIRKRKTQENETQVTAIHLCSDVIGCVLMTIAKPYLHTTKFVCKMWYRKSRETYKKLGNSPSENLSDEQYKFFVHTTELRKSAFLTGYAGTGKSFAFNTVKNALLAKNLVVVTCAPTWTAAVNVGGVTIHNAFGIGQSLLTNEQLNTAVKNENSHYHKYVKEARLIDVIMIDEVSMVDCHIWEWLNIMLQKYRGSTQVFGGVQVLCFGDMLQLQPVSSKEVRKSNAPPMTFCFESKSWRELFLPEGRERRTFYLTHPMRQSMDSPLFGILTRMRTSTMMKEHYELLNRRNFRKLDEEEEGNLFYLVTTKESARRKNDEMLDRLPLPTHTYSSSVQYHGKANLSQKFRETANHMLKESRFTDTIVLKKMARVMVVWNYPIKGIYNGTVGTIVDFYTEDDLKKLRKETGKVFPSIGRVTPEIDVEDGDDDDDVNSVDSVDSIHFTTGSTKAPLPLFKPDGGKGVCYLIYPETQKFTVKVLSSSGTNGKMVFKNETIATKTQLPITLGWAATIHKAQGATIRRAVVDIKYMWELGQMYVALSRFLDINGIQRIALPELKRIGELHYHKSARDFDRECLEVAKRDAV